MASDNRLQQRAAEVYAAAIRMGASPAAASALAALGRQESELSIQGDGTKNNRGFINASDRMGLHHLNSLGAQVNRYLSQFSKHDSGNFNAFLSAATPQDAINALQASKDYHLGTISSNPNVMSRVLNWSQGYLGTLASAVGHPVDTAVAARQSVAHGFGAVGRSAQHLVQGNLGQDMRPSATIQPTPYPTGLGPIDVPPANNNPHPGDSFHPSPTPAPQTYPQPFSPDPVPRGPSFQPPSGTVSLPNVPPSPHDIPNFQGLPFPSEPFYQHPDQQGTVPVFSPPTTPYANPGDRKSVV